MTSEIRRDIKERRRLSQKSKRNNSDETKNKYRQIRNKIVNSVREAKLLSENKTQALLTNPNTTTKKWWSIIKSELKSPGHMEIPHLEHNGDIIVDDAKKSEILNNYFVEQATVDDANMIIPPDTNLNYQNIDDLEISVDDVQHLLVNLNCNKATGVDQIGNRLLKEAAPSISQILSHIFNKSLADGIFPEYWKRAMVIPLFKKGQEVKC